ncbi:MAG: hypothetical protein HETSPECPRED_005854 [Heterodermia speciosa]|uniref:Uncharacterized protein n=1 Tax=Heterodermia speciosa TaxID=116794 RepID=A0A8H3FKN6_9LECA|nr:MAG: hypothetical protein HETSPECPRED_005854 [Heterodermia speciosa]
MPISPVKKRPRCDSLERFLYDEPYKNYVKATFHPIERAPRPWALDAPPPIFDHEALTSEIIEHIYHYSNWRLKCRRVSPRSKPFLEKFKETAKETITAPTDMLKIKLAAWNYTLRSGTILKKEPSFEEKEAFEALQDLTIFRYSAHYGDYLSEECLTLREQAMAFTIARS